ncbi:Alpha/Beta hydrolase protein [Mycena rosella]|uniref:Alpha/Beta hydrolase protein n=1 Tax=Mycena rosella TaxID=1033263 RepID=A0AAD7DDM3_MYCRO|nr:Alpha/Beta hydrolase protein [Mycena rosella]
MHGRPVCSGVGSVTWSPSSECAPGTECGSVIVPKDYFDANAGTASIAIARLKATKSPKKGTVFMNPGGPGGSGTRLATQQFADIIGHDWDLLGFDPRGINKTTPQVKCFDSHTDYHFFVANTVLQQGFTVGSSSNLSDPALEAQLVEQSREFLALKKSQAKLCAKNMGDELKYMGTATVVRDMDFMSKIFDGEDGKINFWGGSYGSILGAYLVNMLPDRAGFVVIDGIADPVNWSTEPSHKWPINWLASTEKTYRFYLEACSHAGPEACPLTQYQDEPFEEIEARIESFFDRLAVTPLPVPFAFRPGFLTSGAARALLLMYLERPPQWADSATALAEAMAGNGTLLFNKLATPPPASTPSYDLVRLGVTCIDSPPPESSADMPTAEDLAAEFLKTMREVSPHFGASVSVGEPDGGCQYWKFSGPERFTGPWNATLEWPMLIVSNTMDPITPIESGLRINSLMPDSTHLIIQDGPGHCSTAIPTLCTTKLIRDYYAGTLPENGTMCETAYDFFPDPSGADRPIFGLDVEDKRLLESAQAVAELLRDVRRR